MSHLIHQPTSLRPPASRRARVCVIGQGVVGLSTAVLLQEMGYAVQVYAKPEPADGPPIVSKVAAAFWHPFCVDVGPLDEAALAAPTLEFWHELLGDPRTGLSPVVAEDYLDAASWDRFTAKWWHDHPLTEARLLTPGEVPCPTTGLGDLVAGLRFHTIVAHMPTYLRYLAQRFQAAGGRIQPVQVGSDGEDPTDAINALADRFDLVVNCAGLGARELVGDREKLYPVQGQVVCVRDVPFEKLVLVETEALGDQPLYIVPRAGHDVVVGGTTVPWAWDNKPQESVSRSILQRAAALHPPFAASRDVSRAKAGLRPYRAPVRIEADERYALPVVHNYGHGGAGVTLSWGCGQRVAKLAQALV